MSEWIKENRWLAIVAGLALAALVFVFWPKGARADTITKGSPVAIGQVANATWSGIGIGVYGAYINADTDTSPFSEGSTGTGLGGAVTASVQMGQIVVEGFGEYGWVFGDLKDALGVNTEINLGGSVGYLVNASTKVYVLGAKSWVDTDAGSVDGWQAGGGIQTRLPNSALFLKLEYRHGWYNTEDILCVDSTADVVRVGLDYKFNFFK